MLNGNPRTAARWALTVMAGLLPLAAAQNALIIKVPEESPKERLGERIFHDVQFSHPGSQFSTSCRSCHIPERGATKDRIFTDELPLSLVPSSDRGTKVTTQRNTPTLLDVAQADRFNWDGRYDSLEALVRDKVIGPHFGWTPGDRDRALEEIQSVLLHDAGTDARADGTYVEQFKKAYDVDLRSMSKEEVFGAFVQPLVEYVKYLRTYGTGLFSAFEFINRIPGKRDPHETPQEFGMRVFTRLYNQEGRLQLKAPQGWDMETYRGMKLFYQTIGEAERGNCISCHLPPTFSDFKFHNTGVVQLEYDGVHGEGAFAKLVFPKERGTEATLSRPAKDNPALVDLGHWNWVDVKASPLRAEGESDEAFLERMAGAFKTPPLRNLDRTDPYMHNGAYATLEEAVRQKIKAAELARAGKLRGGDPEMANIYLTEADIAPLVKFLKALNEITPEGQRDLATENVEVMEGPFF